MKKTDDYCSNRKRDWVMGLKEISKEINKEKQFINFITTKRLAFISYHVVNGFVWLYSHLLCQLNRVQTRQKIVSGMYCERS